MYSQNYFQQSYQPNQSQMPRGVAAPQLAQGLKGRLVSSIEEARAQTIDFDGSIFYFPDIANGRIYTKQINMDGTATLNMYEIKEIPKEQVGGVNYVTREEFEQTLQQVKAAIESLAPPPETVPTSSQF